MSCGEVEAARQARLCKQNLRLHSRLRIVSTRFAWLTDLFSFCIMYSVRMTCHMYQMLQNETCTEASFSYADWYSTRVRSMGARDTCRYQCEAKEPKRSIGVESLCAHQGVGGMDLQ